MPDKRQESKQRRAARNRASREALAARRDNALTSPTPRPSASSATPGGKAGATSGHDAGSAPRASGPPPGGLLGQIRSGRPGDIAVLVSLLLAVLGAVFALFVRVRVDARGEPWPLRFEAVAKEAQRVMGEQVSDRTVSLLDAYGAQVPLLLALPIVVTAFAVWANRRPDRSRLLTFAMFAMFGAVMIAGFFTNIFILSALVALAIASFRVRRADMPARIAEKTTGAGRGGRSRGGRGVVIDAESQDVTDETSVDEVEPEGPADAAEPEDETVTAEAADDDEVDPLVELEAEIEAERAAEAEGETGAGPTDGRRRRKR